MINTHATRWLDTLTAPYTCDEGLLGGTFDRELSGYLGPDVRWLECVVGLGKLTFSIRLVEDSKMSAFSRLTHTPFDTFIFSYT